MPAASSPSLNGIGKHRTACLSRAHELLDLRLLVNRIAGTEGAAHYRHRSRNDALPLRKMPLHSARSNPEGIRHPEWRLYTCPGNIVR